MASELAIGKLMYELWLEYPLFAFVEAQYTH